MQLFLGVSADTHGWASLPRWLSGLTPRAVGPCHRHGPRPHRTLWLAAKGPGRDCNPARPLQPSAVMTACRPVLLCPCLAVATGRCASVRSRRWPKRPPHPRERDGAGLFRDAGNGFGDGGAQCGAAGRFRLPSTALVSWVNPTLCWVAAQGCLLPANAVWVGRRPSKSLQ